MIKASFEQVTKKYAGRVIFNQVSFQLKEGGRYALMGPNGSGKSTLVRLLAGELCPDHGQVLVDGKNPFKRPQQTRAKMGLLPEGSPLIGDLSVREHLRLAGTLKGLTRTNYNLEEERLVQALGLKPFYNRPTTVLSYGQKKRVALASALLGQPDFIILDEPTSGLDPAESDRLLSLLTALPPTSTLLISSHILGELHQLTEEILVLNQGNLVDFKPWAELLNGKEATEQSLKQIFIRLTAEVKS